MAHTPKIQSIPELNQNDYQPANQRFYSKVGCPMLLMSEGYHPGAGQSPNPLSADVAPLRSRLQEIAQEFPTEDLAALLLAQYSGRVGELVKLLLPQAEREEEVGKLRRTRFIACPNGGYQLEMLLEHLNLDPRLHEYGVQVNRSPARVLEFTCHDHLASIEDSVRDRPVYLVQGFTQGGSRIVDKTSSELIDLLWTTSAAGSNHASDISVEMMFHPYGRSDKKFQGGQHIADKDFLALIEAMGRGKCKRFLTSDPHNESEQGFTDVPMDSISMIPLFATYFRYQEGLYGKGITVVAPDEGGVKRATILKKLLGASFAFTEKSRKQGKKAEVGRINGPVRNRVCIVIDDMIDGGGTAAGVIQKLYKMGARQVYFAATHGLYSKSKDLADPLPEELLRQSKGRIITTDTIPRSPAYLKRNADWLTMLTVRGYLADLVAGPYFGDRVRTIHERYQAVARGDIQYDKDGTIRMPDGAPFAYRSLDRLILPNERYLMAFQRDQLFRKEMAQLYK